MNEIKGNNYFFEKPEMITQIYKKEHESASNETLRLLDNKIY